MKRLLLVIKEFYLEVFLHGHRASFVSSFLFIVFISLSASSQPVNDGQKTEAYKKVITERVSKIINNLAIKDSVVYNRVLSVIINQYADNNAIHEESKSVIAEINLKSSAKEKAAEAVKEEEKKKSGLLLQRHQEFIAHLKKDLSDEQLEKVKDGMTYNVLNVTYTAYRDMIPGLTTEQKQVIYDWLKEAREKAMDESSSEDKHKMFGKYKGKINNYLSSQGYDMKMEEKAWQQRLREKREKEAAEKQKLS